MKKKTKWTFFITHAHSRQARSCYAVPSAKPFFSQRATTGYAAAMESQKTRQPADSYIVPPLIMQSNKIRKKKILTLFLRAEKKAEKLRFFRKSYSCLIGVSGGQDSICLGIFIRSLERKWKFKFEFVYCHHAWQQENFHTLMQITQYAAYTNVGYFVFLNPRSSS